MRVVVADDNPEMVLRAESVLRKCGHIVVGKAHNGKDALAAIREHLPDFALLDYSMPNLSGAEVAAAVRAEGLSVRIIMATANGQRGAAFGDEVDADAVLIKPFSAPFVNLRVAEAFAKERS